MLHELHFLEDCSFSRDMVLNILFVADLNLLKDHRQLIDERALHSNKHRHAYDYQPGQEVLKLVYKPDKLEPQAQGPYEILAVHTNGMLTIQLKAMTIEHISIRNVKPFSIELGAIFLLKGFHSCFLGSMLATASANLRARMCHNV
jgi:hypothetical protein